MRKIIAARKRKHSQKGSKLRRSRYGRSLLGLGVVCVALAGAVLAPSPYNDQRGTITLVGTDPSAEIYGPEAPKARVRGYTVPTIQSAVLPEDDDSANAVEYVYASSGQKNYHKKTCKFAYASAQCLTLYEAYYLGYTPGNCCSPPSYTG